LSSRHLISPVSSSRGVLGLATKTYFSSPRKLNSKDPEEMPAIVSSDRKNKRKTSLLEDKSTFDLENKSLYPASFQKKPLDF